MRTVLKFTCNSQAEACDIMSHMSSCAALGNPGTQNTLPLRGSTGETIRASSAHLV